jgi:hypothetical protein
MHTLRAPAAMSTPPKPTITANHYRNPPSPTTATTIATRFSGTIWKIITGSEGSACYMGPQYPNASDPSCNKVLECGDGCLFNLSEDPGEFTNLNGTETATLQVMQDLLAKMNEGFFDPTRGGGDESVPNHAAVSYGGFWGPFLP